MKWQHSYRLSMHDSELSQSSRHSTSIVKSWLHWILSYDISCINITIQNKSYIAGNYRVPVDNMICSRLYKPTLISCNICHSVGGPTVREYSLWQEMEGGVRGMMTLRDSLLATTVVADFVWDLLVWMLSLHRPTTSVLASSCHGMLSCDWNCVKL